MLTSVADKREMVAKTRETDDLRCISANGCLLTHGEALLTIEIQSVRMLRNRAEIRGCLAVIFLAGLQTIRPE